MRRRSQTETAVLGALSVEPMTGYAVREAIRDVLGHFWSESFGQIYPKLAELERSGHVRRRGSRRSGSSIFAITASGRARLKELLAEPIQPEPPRNGLMLRLFFGRQVGPEASRSLVEQARADAERRLAEFQTVRSEVEREETYAQDRPYWLLTIAAGEHSARAAIAWADEALAALDQIHPSSDGPQEGGTDAHPRQPDSRSNCGPGRLGGLPRDRGLPGRARARCTARSSRLGRNPDRPAGRSADRQRRRDRGVALRRGDRALVASGSRSSPFPPVSFGGERGCSS